MSGTEQGTRGRRHNGRARRDCRWPSMLAAKCDLMPAILPSHRAYVSSSLEMQLQPTSRYRLCEAPRPHSASTNGRRLSFAVSGLLSNATGAKDRRSAPMAPTTSHRQPRNERGCAAGQGTRLHHVNEAGPLIPRASNRAGEGPRDDHDSADGVGSRAFNASMGGAESEGDITVKNRDPWVQGYCSRGSAGARGAHVSDEVHMARHSPGHVGPESAGFIPTETFACACSAVRLTLDLRATICFRTDIGEGR